MAKIVFVKDFASYKKDDTADVETMTAGNIVNRGFAKFEKDVKKTISKKSKK